jgi:hypothetical protein
VHIILTHFQSLNEQSNDNLAKNYTDNESILGMGIYEINNVTQNTHVSLHSRSQLNSQLHF